jgi:hypothetical protein
MPIKRVKAAWRSVKHGIKMATLFVGEFVYLLIEREFRSLPLDRRAFKIGRSTGLLNRLGAYPKGIALITCLPVNDSVAAEALLLRHFDAVFGHRRDIGREYFAGDIDAIVTAFITTIVSHHHLSYCAPTPPPDHAPGDSTHADSAHADSAHDDSAHADSAPGDSAPGDPHAHHRPELARVDLDRRVGIFFRAVRDDLAGTDVPLLDFHDRFISWLGLPNERPIGVRKFRAILLSAYGIKATPSPNGAILRFSPLPPGRRVLEIDQGILHRPPEHRFLKRLIGDALTSHQKMLTVKLDTLYTRFLDWCTLNMQGLSYQTSNNKFGIQISMLIGSIEGISKMRHGAGMVYRFDVDKVAANMIAKQWACPEDFAM